MANSIEKAKLYQTALDEQMVSEALTSWMEGNASGIKYTGGSEVKVPKITLGGLKNYSRTDGYPAGDVTLGYETLTMSCDRATGFTLDAMDVDESGLDDLAGLVMGEFQRTKVIPEVDAYRISTIADKAITGTNYREKTIVATDKVFDELLTDIATVRDKIGTTQPLVIHMATKLLGQMEKELAYARIKKELEMKVGEITLKVTGIDGDAIIGTPGNRMTTKITLNTGASAGYTAGTRNVNWLIMTRNAPVAVCKTDTIRIFDPETYQGGHAWHIDYRKFHDVWLMDNKLPGVFANVTAVPTQSGSGGD